MNKKTMLSIILVFALLVTVVSIPAFAAYSNTFQLAGRIVLPGEDKAPEGGLIVTLEYRTDKGTADVADDKVTPIIIQLNAGTRETYFSVNIEKTNPEAKFSLSYTVPASSKYWDKGYYSSSGMQYYKEGQTLFSEGTVIKNLVITPIRASRISGKVTAPTYTTSQGAIAVDVSAKTAGASSDTKDDYTAETTVSLTKAAISYSLKVPATAASAGYTVMYETSEDDYEHRGWYSATGTTLTASKATKVDVSKGNRSGIDLELIKEDAYDKFELEGKVVLPGTDKAPDGGLVVTVIYTTDKGTKDTKDDIDTPFTVKLNEGEHEKSFSLDFPYTVDEAKYSLSYTVPSSSKYWDKGYYTANGMKYYKADQLFFDEGDEKDDLVITPIRASKISGEVALPDNSSTQGAIKVDIKAKTTGTSSGTADDFEVKTNVTVNDDEADYTLKVPATASNAGYTVMYATTSAGYEKQGWYSANGTVTEASKAAKVDVSKGNCSDIDLVLVKDDSDDPETPGDIDYDLNNDGFVNVRDMVLVARAMGAKHKYVEEYDLNSDDVINVVDLKLIKAEIKKTLKKFKNDWVNYFGEDWEEYFGKDLEEYFDQEWDEYLEMNWGKNWNKKNRDWKK